ncbi:hypothetical protein TrVFT333_002681 [Trichoderma virens FT-333]|nr:hypothetical protein TrVFT333_002681 [Trichoderma virens FT-333]
MASKDSQYGTKGLPPPPNVSVVTKPMAGLLVDIYGLQELPRLQHQAVMHDIAKRAVHSWNQGQKQKQRGLVALVFDMPNHGTRMVSELANQAWDEGNEQHAIDMLGLVKAGAVDASGLMDQVAGYLGRETDAHVCLGWSLGGHAAWQAWFGEDRMDAAVVIVGCPDLAGLLGSRAAASKLDYGGANFLGSKYFPADSIATDRLRKILDSRVRGKKLLLCSGGADELVPYAQAEPLIRVLKDAVGGWYADGGVEVDDRVYEGVGHRFAADMVNDAVAFLMRVVAEGPRQKSESRAKM